MRRCAGGERRGAGELRAARPGAGGDERVPRSVRERGRAAAFREVERLAERLAPAERDQRVGALERRVFQHRHGGAQRLRDRR